MSKSYLIDGNLMEDNLTLVVNTRDSDINISVDYLSNTPDFKRVSYELDLDGQIRLAKQLAININKWK